MYQETRGMSRSTPATRVRRHSFQLAGGQGAHAAASLGVWLPFTCDRMSEYIAKARADRGGPCVWGKTVAAGVWRGDDDW
jgi:hypothetical protein